MRGERHSCAQQKTLPFYQRGGRVGAGGFLPRQTLPFYYQGRRVRVGIIVGLGRRHCHSINEEGGWGRASLLRSAAVIALVSARREGGGRQHCCAQRQTLPFYQ